MLALWELLNRIPLLDYTADDVLAEVSHRGKPLIGKWEHSLIAVSEGRIIAVLIAHMKQADPPYYPEALFVVRNIAKNIFLLLSSILLRCGMPANSDVMYRQGMPLSSQEERANELF